MLRTTTLNKIFVVIFALVVASACGGSDSDPNGGRLLTDAGTSSDTDNAPVCGNGTKEPGEACDNNDFGSITCQSLGFSGGGQLSCTNQCGKIDTSGCNSGECTPQCGDRECGPDPNCGISCGTCQTGSCNSNGQCEQEQSGNQSPRIVSLSTNTDTVHEETTFKVTAIVTDPDGISDIIGGELRAANSSSSYGSFQSAAQEGSYEISLAWDDFNDVQTIGGGIAGSQRTLTARFFDQSGNEATQEITVSLTCEGNNMGACEGSCVDLSSNEQHCGGCNQPVLDAGGDTVCRNGKPACSQFADYEDQLCGSGSSAYCAYTHGDPNHCGQCGFSCTSNEECESAKCEKDITNNDKSISCDTVCQTHGYDECVYADTEAVTILKCGQAPEDDSFFDPSKWPGATCTCARSA